VTDVRSADPQPNVLHDAAAPNVFRDASTPNVLHEPDPRGASGTPPATGGWSSSGLAVGLVLIVVTLAIAGGLGRMTPARDPCSVVDDLVADDVPEQAVRAPRAWMPSRVAPGYVVTWESPLTLDLVVASRVNPEEVRIELTRDGFADGYEQEWEGTLDVGFSAYRFSATEGAQGFNAFGNRFACQFANEAFRGPRGSIGLQVRYASGRIGEQISWVSGDTRVVVISFHDQAPPDHSAIEALVALVPSP